MAKKALCFGINDYPGTQNDLAGCVNDAKDWTAALRTRGFDVQTILDAQATKAAMAGAIESLVGGAKAGDSLVITYSGHGTFVPDRNGDEPDHHDEALCPYDIDQGRVLVDDDIHALFARRPAGVRLVLISDSCHSGSVIRWAQPDAASDAPRPRFLPPAAWMPANDLPRTAGGDVPARVPRGTRTTWLGAGGDLLLAGCQDDEYSYDARFGGKSNGAFTYYALKALATLKPDATYADWYAAIRKYLPGASYPQTPQLFGGRRNRTFPALG